MNINKVILGIIRLIFLLLMIFFAYFALPIVPPGPRTPTGECCIVLLLLCVFVLLPAFFGPSSSELKSLELRSNVEFVFAGLGGPPDGFFNNNK